MEEFPDEPAEEDDHDVVLSTRHMLLIPGTYHVIELIQKRLLDQYSHFADIKKGLESACFIFHHSYTRNPFKESLQGDHLLWQRHFVTGPPLFEGGRVWAVVIKVAAWFKVRRSMITRSWAGYVAHGDVDTERAEHHRNATAAFANDLFWGYNELNHCFSDFLDHVSHWCTSCSCHPAGPCDEAGIEAERHLCSMRARRVSEIACGGLEKFVSEASEMALTALVMELAGMAPVSTATLKSEFQVGKRFVTTELRLRIEAYYRLPIKAVSVGHPDERKARAGLAICLALHSQGGDNARHPLCERLFGVGPDSMRASVIAVVHGDWFSQHPALLQQRRKMRFVSNSEISVERDHAMLHQHLLTASNHTEAYASVQMRKSEIVKHMESSEEHVAQLANHLADVRSAKAVASHLSLLTHTGIADPDHVDMGTCRRIVYRADLQTQYARLPPVSGPEQGHGGPPPAAPPGPPGIQTLTDSD